MAHASFAEWGGRVAVNWIEIAAIFSLAAFFEHWLGYLAALLMLGTRQHALAILGHDGAHRFVSRNKKINDLTTCLLVFWPLGVGLDGYRQFHYRHHRRAGKPEDPEMDIKNMSPREWRKPLSHRRMLGLVLRDLSGFALRDIYRLVKVIRPVTFRDWLGPLLWWSVAGVAAYELGALWAVALWWLAIISSYWAVFRMRAWSEHFDTPGTYRISANWWQKMIFLPHNTWCHFEHHKWPGVPCWNLPKARALDRGTPIIPLAQLLHSFGEPRERVAQQDTAHI